VVSDLGSTNGTMVNDAPVSGARRLEEGDRITIGRSVLEFRGR
jgi:pSer/pThr/pTyr-binding forkhead associated (FHA) protein